VCVKWLALEIFNAMKDEWRMSGAIELHARGGAATGALIYRNDAIHQSMGGVFTLRVQSCCHLAVVGSGQTLGLGTREPIAP
jgi:hypothetical protein